MSPTLASSTGAKRSLADWLSYAESNHPKSMDLGLDRVRRVAERLDVLTPAPLSLIVAGTNGKGSTAIAAEALGLAAGLKVGATLSPHVHRFNERVRIQGAPLDDAVLADLFAQVEAARGTETLTYFEFSTLVALLGFKQAQVELAVLEVGLGGRLDAFNIVDADLAVVTSIGLDHQDWLGADLQQIGREKAGVFRQGQPVVVGAVTDSVIDAARKLGCPLQRLGCEFSIHESAQEWVYRSDQRTGLRIPRSDLAPANCALAIAALSAHLQLSDAQIVAALSGLSLTGRMEQHLLRGVGLKQGVRLILDVAHNPAGAAFLCRQLQQRFPGQRFIAICGMLADKDAPGVAAALESIVRQWLTVDTTGPRGQSAARLAERLAAGFKGENAGPHAPNPAITTYTEFGDACVAAVSCAGAKDAILAFGSFNVVEQARNHLDDLSKPHS